MAALAGPFIACAALLGAGGALKVSRPAPTARALRAVRLPGSPALVRAGAAAEVAVAVAAIAWASRPVALAVAASYLGFAGFVLAALRRDVPLSSCGCFGVQDTPPTVGHVVLNLAAATVALAVAVSPHGAGLGAVGDMDGPLFLRALFVAMTATAAWFAYVALTVVPQVLATRKAAA